MPRGFEMTVGVVGGKEIRRSLAVVVDKSQDLRPAWSSLREVIMNVQKQTFLGKGRPSRAQYFETNLAQGLRPWKKLAPSTLQSKSAKGYDKPGHPLIATGKLMKAWTKRRSGEGAVRVEEKQVFAFGIDEDDIPYALYHQTARPGGRLPRRRHYRTPRNFRKMVVRVLQKHLVSQRGFQRLEGFVRKNPLAT